jgi:poly(A) polymerase
MELLYEPKRGIFFDPMGIYRSLREKVLIPENTNHPDWVILFEAAKLISKFHYSTDTELDLRVDGRYEPPEDCQRELLIGVLSGEYPNKGFSLLLESGFIEKYWPEIFIMTETSHSKDFHPEGNVWEHTLEALKFRKKRNIELSLALLLHDIGKAYSVSYGDKPFFNHSIVGSRVARRFLQRLRFSRDTIENVLFLIKHHMFPHAMNKMPPHRREKIMESELFPMLLEVYRADISSSYNELETYYEACRIYKNYLRERKNPFRSLKSARMHRTL